jgi:hypothetical protein
MPGDKIDVLAEFSIDFAEIEFPRSPTEEAAEWSTLILYNIKTAIDWIKSRNPDLTDDQAKKIYLENKTLNSVSEVNIKKTAQPGQGSINA